MAIKNIFTQIKTERTISEIESILLKFGANGIYKEYQGNKISGLMFFLLKDRQKIPFKIPMSIEKTRAIIIKAVNEGKLPKRFLEEPLRSEQGERVVWRVIKDWIHSQLSLFEIEFADAIQIMLPYAYNIVEKKTMYEQFLENKEKFLALESNGEEK